MTGVLPVNVHEKLSGSGSLCIAPNRVNARAVWFFARLYAKFKKDQWMSPLGGNTTCGRSREVFHCRQFPLDFVQSLGLRPSLRILGCG